MIDEDMKGTLLASLNAVDYSYNETSFSPEVMRGYEDYPRKDPFIVVEFFPTGNVIGASLGNNYIGQRQNPIYSDYGYGEEEICNIKACARTSGSIHGRILAYHFLNKIEMYIRGQWQSILGREGFIKQHTFTPYRNIPSILTEKQIIYEMEFVIVSQRGWSDEPENNAQIVDNVSGINITSGVSLWVN